MTKSDGSTAGVSVLLPVFRAEMSEPFSKAPGVQMVFIKSPYGAGRSK